jgi:hypothetical protein
MQEEVKRYADRLRAEQGVNLQVRVGVNTGEVVVRSITTGDGKTEYTPIGHSTSLASRLQTLANPGSIAVSEAVRKLVLSKPPDKPLRIIARTIESNTLILLACGYASDWQFIFGNLRGRPKVERQLRCLGRRLEFMLGANLRLRTA